MNCQILMYMLIESLIIEVTGKHLQHSSFNADLIRIKLY